MASKRCLPTRFFKDPDIMNVDKDTQLILVGLVLLADDEGRELAHAKLLSRELDYPAEQIESALQDLEDNDLLLLYQEGRHRYYSLTRWNQWQTINRQKMTPSRYPAPPGKEIATMVGEVPGMITPSTAIQQQGLPLSSPSMNTSILSPACSGEIWGNPGESGESLSESNLIESNSSESKISEDEGEMQPPPNVVPFPTPRADVAGTSEYAEKTLYDTTKQVAAILKLPVTDSLQRVVADYLGDGSISLLGEADAAREWIEDSKRNHKQQSLTPAFFRRWLKREHDTTCRGYGPPGTLSLQTKACAESQRAQVRLAANGTGPPGTPLLPAYADNPYHVFVQQRAQAVLRRSAARQEEGEIT